MPSTLPTIPTNDETLDISTLEQWLWDAACAIRGNADAPKFKDFILPLIFYKRLSDVFDDESVDYVTMYGSREEAEGMIRRDHEDALRRGRTDAIVRFFVPSQYTWEAFNRHGADGTLGEFVTTAMREVALLNPDLQGVLDVKDYNEKQSGQRTIDDDRLAALIEVINQHRLGLHNTASDVLGQAYEYLLRKFAEGQGQSAGEFYTPKEVAELIAGLIDPLPGTTIYDPACGTAGLLIRARLYYAHHQASERAPHLYGQELNPTTFAIAKMNMALHDFADAHFAIGDTMRKPGFAAEGAGLKRFDYVVANPMWNQDQYDEAFYDQDEYTRFGAGAPSKSSADWGWAQHMLASLNEHGRAAIVLDTGAVSRGSGSKSSNRERDIRKAFVEHDWIEGVILLPENLFYNTSAPGIILLLNRAKPAEWRQQFLLINASARFIKGKPKNALTEEGIQAVTEIYRAWETREKLSRVVTLDEVRAADYNLSPSQFVEVNDKAQHRPMSEILADLAEARAERERADAELTGVLARIGLNGEANFE